jgi:hypothetical protein
LVAVSRRRLLRKAPFLFERAGTQPLRSAGANYRFAGTLAYAVLASLLRSEAARGTGFARLRLGIAADGKQAQTPRKTTARAQHPQNANIVYHARDRRRIVVAAASIVMRMTAR